MILIACKLMEAIFLRIGAARILAYLCTGFALALYRFATGYEMSHEVIALSYIGIVALLFLAGLETSFRRFVRELKSASIVAFGGVLGAMVAGLASIPLLGLDFAGALALGITLSATSVSVTVKTFDELGMLGSREAQTIIGAAVVDDVIGLALLSALYSLEKEYLDVVHVATVALLAFALWLGVAFVTNVLSRRLFKSIALMRIEAGWTTMCFALVLLLSYLASKLGLSVILLAYAFGLGIAGFRIVARRLEEQFRLLTYLFLPLFFAYVGYRVEVEELSSVPLHHITYSVLMVIALALLSKVVGCYVASKALGFDNRSALVIGIGMTPRAEVMLVSATIALELELLPHHVFVALLLVVPVTLVLTPLLIKLLAHQSTAP